MSTKIHAATDAHGNPIRLILTGGERSDFTQIGALLSGFQANYVLADRGYDGAPAIEAVIMAGAIPVIPSRRTAKSPRDIDWSLYKERNIVERYFNKIKNFRRIATRYDKLARNYQGFLNLVAAIKWAK